MVSARLEENVNLFAGFENIFLGRYTVQGGVQMLGDEVNIRVDDRLSWNPCVRFLYLDPFQVSWRMLFLGPEQRRTDTLPGRNRQLLARVRQLLPVVCWDRNDMICPCLQ
jgi:hypothetical protein